MGSMAQMVVAGNLARAVEMREAAGHPVVDVIVMVNQKLYKGKDAAGNSRYEEDVMTVSASFWRDRAGSIASLNLPKGAFVILAGNPRIRTYLRNNGEAGAEIILENADLTLGPKLSPDAGGNGTYQRPAAQAQRPPVRQAAPQRAPARSGPMEAPADRQLDLGGEEVPFDAEPPAPAGKAEDDW